MKNSTMVEFLPTVGEMQTQKFLSFSPLEPDDAHVTNWSHFPYPSPTMPMSKIFDILPTARGSDDSKFASSFPIARAAQIGVLTYNPITPIMGLVANDQVNNAIGVRK